MCKLTRSWELPEMNHRSGRGLFALVVGLGVAVLASRELHAFKAEDAELAIK